MISGYGARPIFKYRFTPQQSRINKYDEIVDGGFVVILYENGVTSFSTYGPGNVFLDELCFTMPMRVITYYNQLLRNASNWLAYTPRSMRVSDDCLYASSFGFDGQNTIRVYGINDMVSLINCPEGFYSRHLYVLFEDVANLFAENGVNMTMESFNWDAERIRPFRRQQMTNSMMTNSLIQGIL